MAERLFGTVIINSEDRIVPVRYIGEQHVIEDMGRIPTVADWLSQIEVQSWMYGSRRKLEKELAEEAEETDAPVSVHA